MLGKSKRSALSFNIFWTWTCNKNKFYNISDCFFRDTLNFHSFIKSLGLASPPHFVYDFSRKIFFISHFIN